MGYSPQSPIKKYRYGSMWLYTNIYNNAKPTIFPFGNFFQIMPHSIGMLFLPIRLLDC